MEHIIARFTVVLIIVSVFFGCGAGVKQYVNSPKTVEVQARKQEKNTGKVSEAVGYEIDGKVSENKGINSKISYPQIVGYKGQLLMDYMNQSLRKIVNVYEKKDMYKDISIDYRITKMDRDMLSVLFTGTGKISGGREITIRQSVNLDIKSSNEITFKNFIRSDGTSADKVMATLYQKAKVAGSKYGVEAEGIRVYFERDNVVFFYMPDDDSSKSFMEINFPNKELEGLINIDFGERPAS